MKPKEPREWWIDPDYEGYFDDTDDNLLAGGFVKAIEREAYDAALARNARLETEIQLLKGKIAGMLEGIAIQHGSGSGSYCVCPPPHYQRNGLCAQCLKPSGRQQI